MIFDAIVYFIVHILFFFLLLLILFALSFSLSLKVLHIALGFHLSLESFCADLTKCHVFFFSSVSVCTEKKNHNNDQLNVYQLFAPTRVNECCYQFAVLALGIALFTVIRCIWTTNRFVYQLIAFVFETHSTLKLNSNVLTKLRHNDTCTMFFFLFSRSMCV